MSSDTEVTAPEFNFIQWPASTQITLCNVPWNADYRDIVEWETREERDAYFQQIAGASIYTENVIYHRPNNPIRLNIPFGRAFEYNYIRVYNPAQPLSGDKPRAYYYFINAVNHVAPGTSEFVVQLDVWTTYQFDVTFGNCYIETSHLGIANENQFTGQGRVWLTNPEGLDLGSEYQITRTYTHDIASARARVTNSFGILLLSTVKIDEDPGTVDNPKLKTAEGNGLENLPNGAEAYYFDSPAEFRQFLSKWSDKPWITQGFVSVTAIPRFSPQRYGLNFTEKVVNGVVLKEVSGGSLETQKVTIGSNWRDDIANQIPARYRHLKKFLTSPYTIIEFTTNTGTPLVLKPEMWEGDAFEFLEMPHLAQPGPRIMFTPYRYNAGPASRVPNPSPEYGEFHDGGEFLDMATGIFNLPQFSVTNDGYLSFMAANTHGIAYQHQSADWSQQRALAGADVAYQQATSGINTSRDVSRQQIGAARQTAGLATETAVFRGLAGAAGSIAGGNGVGMGLAAAGQAASTAISVNQINQQMEINTGLQAGVNASQTANMGFIRDTNQGYAQFAAQGDYQNAIAGINAKVQDARMIQPTTSGQVGGDAFLLSVYRWGVDIKVKTLHPGAMARIGEYWLRYGYRHDRFSKMPSKLSVMEKFTYWKLRETYITSSRCPESFKQAIRGIFEKGVTVWRRPEYIGTTDIGDNKPVEGIYLA